MSKAVQVLPAFVGFVGTEKTLDSFNIDLYIASNHSSLIVLHGNYIHHLAPSAYLLLCLHQVSKSFGIDRTVYFY